MRMTGIALILLLILGSIGIALQRTGRAEAVAPIEPSAISTTDQDVLVDTAWLTDRLSRDEDAPTVIDVSDQKQYALEHIPGAIHLWWQDTMNLNGAGYGEAFSLSAPLPYSPDLGASQDDTIVVYDNMSSKYASRVVWQLRTSGYQHAVVLDGGLAAWKGAGNDVSGTPVDPKSVDDPEEIWLANNEITTPDLANRLDAPNLVLIDTRNNTQKADTINDTIRLGQIPGSIALPAESVMREGGTFLSLDKLRKVFSSRDVVVDDEIVVYGRFGAETGQVWLALQLAGYHNVKIYDDGWLAWGFDTSLPVEPVISSPDSRDGRP